MRRWGFEAEFLLEDMHISQVLDLGIKGVSSEFFNFMLECITGVHSDYKRAVNELRRIVTDVKSRGTRLHPYASWSFEDPWNNVRWCDAISHTEYYRWVFFHAAQNPIELHHVGVHLNVSDTELSDDQLVHASGWLRALGFLFILFSANSPFQNGTFANCLSRRSYFYPNRYDVPLWGNRLEFRQWIKREEESWNIFPGRGRCWMSVSPRFKDDDARNLIDRIEVRCIDSGTNLPWPVLEGCCELVNRIIGHAIDHPQLPVGLEELFRNDKEVARLGRRAMVCLNGNEMSALEVAHQWCDGIPSLEHVLQYGSPAEQAVAQLMKGGF